MTSAATTDLGTRYEAAERLLPHQWKDLIFGGRVRPTWIDDTDRFWYANKTWTGTEYVLVDPEAGTREPLFDARRVQAAIAGEIEGVEVRDGEVYVFTGERVFVVDRASSSASATGEKAPNRFFESVSPDGKWSVSVRDHNLFIRDRATSAERQLTADGVEGYAYGGQPDIGTSRFLLELVDAQMPLAVAWSPDSSRFVTHRLDQRELPFMHYVQSTPPDGARPRAYAEHYALVGEDKLIGAEIVVIDAESGVSVTADNGRVLATFMGPVTGREVWWSRNGERVFFLSKTRGDKATTLHSLDPATGKTTLLVEERNETQVQTNAMYGGKPSVHGLASGETIWWSERTGWGHFYLYARDGSSRALTSGDWIARDLVAVDEDARTLVFSAGGREPGVDPYVRQLYRVSLDGGDVERTTHDALDHDATGSPSGRFMVDVSSWVDVPDSSRVLDGAGATVVEFGQSDVELLFEAGWQAPERFTVKSADGVTDLYGLLYRPQSFNPGERYAVVEDIYPGPQIGGVSVRFCDTRSGHAASMAALGFAVVVVDGRGTPFRSKAFQDYCRGAHDGDWLEDHVAALEQLGERYPWLDLDRVGIYGHSGGGRASTHAILRRGDVYKVAVSLCGNHDDEIYHPGWGEKYHGLVGEGDYRAHANPTYAGNLRGKLFLIHGELDNNVNPYLTLRLTDALMAANKDFDLLIVPNADHSMMVRQNYWLRRRWDYFVQHLLGVEPPEYEIAEIPISVDDLMERFA